MSKKKKEKIIYYDDNSTLSDMSNVKGGKKEPRKSKSTAKEKWKTYFAAVKSMLLPMFIVLAVMALIFIVLMLLITFR